jgi:hypothetical protein
MSEILKLKSLLLFWEISMALMKNLSDFKVHSVLWKNKTLSSETDMLNGKKKSLTHKLLQTKKESLKTLADKSHHLQLKSPLLNLNLQQV